MIDLSAYTWQDEAACYGMPNVLFFGPEEEKKPAREVRELKAKAVCAGCVVRSECLDFGLGQRGGVFGGMNDEERDAERRRRARRAARAAAGVA